MHGVSVAGEVAEEASSSYQKARQGIVSDTSQHRRPTDRKPRVRAKFRQGAAPGAAVLP